MPICPECDSSEIDFYRSRWTRRPVYRDAKVMAKCKKCGNVFIVFDKYLETSVGVPIRKRWWRVIVYALGTAFGFAHFWFDIFSNALTDELALAMAFVFGLLGILEVILWRTLALGRRLHWFDSERVQEAVLMVAMILWLALTAYLGHRINPV